MPHRILLVFSGVLLIAASTLSLSFESQASQPRTQARSRPVPLSGQTDEGRYDSLMRDHLEGMRYKGIHVNPHPAAKGAELEIQNSIARLISRLDFVPEFRIQQFRWIPERAGTTITGWQGDILNVRRTSQGILVDLRVIPRMYGSSLHTSDYTVETYLYTNGKLHHINSTRPLEGGVTTWS